MKKLISLILILFLLTPILNIVTADNSPNIIYVDVDGSGDFTSIQDAIDSANNGDTIFVREGIYYENLVMNKSIYLYGANKENTIIHGINTLNIITISSSDCLISHFTIENASLSENFGAAVNIYNKDNICFNNRITDNILKDIGYGIKCGYRTSYTSIMNNQIILTEAEYSYGIWISNSIGNYINYNTIIGFISKDKDFITPTGINLWKCHSSSIQGNSFYDLQIGIDMSDSSFNEIKLNKFNNSYGGIRLTNSFENEITKNSIIGNFKGKGIFLMPNSFKNIISYNNITHNYKGIYLQISNNNLIFRNNLYQNTLNGYVHYHNIGKNTWDNNYWGRSKILPKYIFGEIIFEKISNHIFFPWFNVDWHPAKEPIKIDI